MSTRSVGGWSRRDFLKLAGGAGLITLPGLAAAAELLNPDTVTISLLHTTDLHGHILPTSDYSGRPNLGGLARCMTQIRRWRDENPNTILIDVGDVYQGTDVALRSRGELMIDLLNLANYDAWVIGNHEFDWGIEPFVRAVERSSMPVLAANSVVESKPAGEFNDAKNPLSKIQPHITRDVAGLKIAIVGVTTPGIPYWLRRDFTEGIEFKHPVEPVRRAINQAKAVGANAVVLAGHMGLKDRYGGDDFANSVMALTSEFPDTAAFIAGHTHQHVPRRNTNSVLFTQADHFGIHVGRLDLTFDRSSKKLLSARANCELMDERFELDPVIVSRAKPQLEQSEGALSQPIGELAQTLSVHSRPGEPSDVEMLIGAAVIEALRERGVHVDAVLHGLFDDKAFRAGPKTINDIWQVLPYENYLVTAELTPDELKLVMDEIFLSHEPRNLIGLHVRTTGRGRELRVASITSADGLQLDGARQYSIALNSFDSRSAGHRFMKLRDLVDAPAASCQLHQLQTRDALIEYFRRHTVVRRIASARELPLAA
jgi:2',3'-cyclic-nucleotide 2'-phosphodiesterase/3'-nucleotidase